MEQRRLGQSDLMVSALGLGCMGMSFAYGTPESRDPEEAIATLHEAGRLGINFLDSAEVYGPYTNEALLAEATHHQPGRYVIASKFGYRITADGKVAGLDGSPANARRACEDSLKRLRVDVIDLYYLHRVDPDVPIEDSVGALADLVTAGKVRYIGLSEANSDTLKRAHAIHPITALQSEYSLFERGIEKDILPTCRALGISVVAYAPLGRGFLTGHVKRAEEYASEGDYRTTLPRFQGENFDRNRSRVATLERLAARQGHTPAQLALAWLLSQGQDIVPIPGARRRLHLRENAAATQLHLASCDLMALEEAFPRNSVAGSQYAEAFMRFIQR
jgi:aryl-alcohol dehydrogenase-like predicted oxidoreductase